MKNLIFLIFIYFLMSCNTSNDKSDSASESKYSKGTFGFDLAFLKKHQKDLIVLKDGEAQVVLSPQYQARVMTSTAEGIGGSSFGWINHEHIASGKFNAHMNAYGGEERFWLGPEGGQFSIFFKKGDKFDIEHWQTPLVIDTVSYDLVEKNATKASFKKEFEIENYSGTKFNIRVNREIVLINKSEAERKLNIQLKDVKWVGYQTVNDVTNIGTKDWDKSKGVLSIWLLGMMNASPSNTIIIPFRYGMGHKINDAYFGKIQAERLKKLDSVLLFKADANSRGKIGVPPEALIPMAGSYDAKNKVLTILQFDYNGEKEYVNSMWEIQKFPYKGDALNAYNDGKNDKGTQLGQFYELESSSPAIALKRNQSLRHTQRTFHFLGNEKQLNIISKQLLGVELKNIEFDKE
jgi:hypothetical protein